MIIYKFDFYLMIIRFNNVKYYIYTSENEFIKILINELKSNLIMTLVF